ncbi:MAG: hypothetical protein ACYTFY_09405 [Planctomycetota bacterium]|jgi:hypothetical protein
MLKQARNLYFFFFSFILFTASLTAHNDTLCQVIKPDPLVKGFEAEDLSMFGKAKVVKDEKASAGKAVHLSDVKSGFKLKLGKLPVGMHVIFLNAKVTDEAAWYEGKVSKGSYNAQARRRKTLTFKLKVNSKNDGSTEEYLLRVPFSDRYEYMTKIYFHTPEKRNYRAEIFIGENSIVKDVIVDRVELRNPLGRLDFAAFKKKSILHNEKKAALERTAAAKEKKLYSPLRNKPLSVEKRAERDRVLWQNVMPLNANIAQAYSSSWVLRPWQKEAVDKYMKKIGKDMGDWVFAGQTNRHIHPFDVPWKLVNERLGLEYTLADYNSGKPLPKPWPFPEDKSGFYFDKEIFKTEKSFTLCRMSGFIMRRYYAVLAALGFTAKGRTNIEDLPGRYYLLGDLSAAADGAILLAAYAYHYPGYDWNLNCLNNILTLGNYPFNVGSVYGRGSSYQGWSTGEVQVVLDAYDKLFPYIKDNEALAGRIGVFVPWVKTSQDVVKLLDTFLLQRAAQDGVDYVLYSPVVPHAAVLLGANKAGEKYLDKYFSRIYLRSGLMGFGDQIINGYSRDGLNYIGSTYYVSGESRGELGQPADLMGLYRKAGGDRRFDISDPKKFPQLAAMADSLLRLQVAGGHWPGAGDVMDPQNPIRSSVPLDEKEGFRFFARVWRMTKDPRCAWMLVNHLGQGDFTDREWKKITDTAAKERDPVLYQSSSVVEGFGTAIINEGVDSEDLRHKTGMTMRFGAGTGHAHADTLDLEILAFGTRITSDLGGRSSAKYGRPNCMKTYVHNLVEVDETSFNGGTAQNATAVGWLNAFKPSPGAQFVMGSAEAAGHPDVSLYNRGALLVMADEGDGKDVLPSSYVFDVFRVKGGKVHTWSFHGAPSEEFKTNAGLQKAESQLAMKYLGGHRDGTELEGVAGDTVEAEWLMRRKEEVIDGIKLKNAEKAMLRKLYDEKAPRKKTKITLFGHKGSKVMVADWYANKRRQHTFPFLYVRDEAENKRASSLWASIIEPIAGKSVITGKRKLQVDDAGSGSEEAVGFEIKTVFDQTDFLYSALDGERVRTVAGKRKASGRLGFVSRDKGGLRQLHLVGGTELQDKDVSVKLKVSSYSAVIVAADYKIQVVQLDKELPVQVLDGEMLTIGNSSRQKSYKADYVKGRTVKLNRDSAIYQGAVEYVNDKGGAVLDVEPPLYNYIPNFYEGTSITDENGRLIGKASIKLGDRFWYLGFPEARQHQAKISWDDVADVNGDGRKTLAMYVPLRHKNGIRKFAADGKTIETVAAGAKMFDLEVTRIRKDGLMIWTKQHPRDYVDAINVRHPGWPYFDQIIKNESGKRQWTTPMPGDTFELYINGKKADNNTFSDADGDGRALVQLHNYGVGDQITVLTHLYLRRIEKNIYELRANAGCEVSLPGKSIEISKDGKEWRKINTVRSGNMCKAVVSLQDLADGIVQLRINK